MNRIYLTVILLGAALPPAAAQRLDGCPERPDPFAGTIVPGIEGVDRGLQYSGVALTREPLLTALADSRPEVRDCLKITFPYKNVLEYPGKYGCALRDQGPIHDAATRIG
jgi:hypothetical protein